MADFSRRILNPSLNAPIVRNDTQRKSLDEQIEEAEKQNRLYEAQNKSFELYQRLNELKNPTSKRTVTCPNCGTVISS